MAVLEFEKTITDLLQKRKELEELSKVHGKDYATEIKVLSKNIERLQKSIFKDLTRWQIVQLSRHPDRPYCLDYINMMVQNWFELHGDRAYGDDSSLVTGFGKIGDRTVCIIGQHKGRSTKEKVFRNFGMPNPEGYRKALRIMRLAERFQIPILSFVDTPGAFPGVEAENRGQCAAISENLLAMSDIRVPCISVVIGEGGSGGALAIGITDWIIMLEYSVYSVISPESCAAILWKDGSEGPRAAELLRLKSSDAKSFGLIEEVVKEPQGGAHRDPQNMAIKLKKALLKRFDELMTQFQQDPDSFLEKRYKKWRNIGKFQIQKPKRTKKGNA